MNTTTELNRITVRVVLEGSNMMKAETSLDQRTNLIPKIIHYCWFGGKPIPDSLQKCIDTWKLLEGYTVMRWDERNCSFDENEFIRKAYREKEFAFISDYYRLIALYEYGGIYLDTDVKVYKSLNELLNYKVFINFIYDCSVGAGIIGAQPGNSFIKSLVDMYNATTFGMNASGKVFDWQGGQLVVEDLITINYYFTYYILKHYPSFRLNNKFQDMEDFVIFPKEYFEIGTLTAKHYTIHKSFGEWRLKSANTGSLKEHIKRIIRKWPHLFEKVQIVVRKYRYYKLKKDIPFYDCYLAQKKGREIPDL